MNSRDEALIQILKLCNELEFRPVGFIDSVPDIPGQVVDVTLKYGIPVSNGNMPVKLFIERMQHVL
jgi:hypothetical protein